MGQEIDYGAVLADLEARRDALDAVIAGVRALLGALGQPEIAPPGVNGGISTRVTNAPQDVVPGMFHGLSVPEAARKFLELKKTKQRMKDIVDGIQRGGIESTAGNFYSNVFTSLLRKKEFIRIGKFWALAEWHPTRAGTAIEKAGRRRKSRKVKKQPEKVKARTGADSTVKAVVEPA